MLFTKRPKTNAPDPDEEPEPYTESFVPVTAGLVLYRRVMPMIGSRSGTCTVEIPMSKHFIEITSGESLVTYLDRAVAAVLTRNGVEEV